MDQDISRILLTSEQIRSRVAEIARQIERDYPQDANLLLVGVLKGSVMFMVDLVRELQRPLAIDFIAISSYGLATETSGVVRVLKDLDVDIGGRHVLIVEDIVDSGLTLAYLRENLQRRNPASLRVVAFLSKPERHKATAHVDYVGFDIPNEFVVGYGLDYAEQYRNLAYIGVLDPRVYSHSG